MNKKVIFSFIITIIILWVSHMWLGNLFPENIYYSDAILLFYPPFIISVAILYFWKHLKYKEIAKGILIGGLIYCFGLWFNIVWDTSEIPCGTKYFFNLLTNCPGIK